jgi:hypothetical protein
MKGRKMERREMEKGGTTTGGQAACFASRCQGEGAWRMAFCAQRKLCFRFAPCALRFANSPGPVKHPQKLFIK